MVPSHFKWSGRVLGGMTKNVYRSTFLNSNGFTYMTVYFFHHQVFISAATKWHFSKKNIYIYSICAESRQSRSYAARIYTCVYGGV